MVDFAQQAAIGPAPKSGVSAMRALVPLTAIDTGQWRALAQRAIEPNAYYLPGWESAVSATARGRTRASALAAFDRASTRLTGMIPVVSLWRAWNIPLPALISAHPYGTLCSPLIDRDAAAEATLQLLQRAKDAGARALILRDVAIEGDATQSLMKALDQSGLAPRILGSHHRACLDATRDADALLGEALGTRKLKELRRQRHRLEEHGIVSFEVARRLDDVRPALETFLQLEASGWKGRRGTALIQHQGDATFIRRAVLALAETAQCEIICLKAGTTPVASGIVLRHQDRAFFFKLGIDERFAKLSPGTQLAVELTRHLCNDPMIASADSTAAADHPMINRIWRDRLAIGDVLIPLRRYDPVVAMIHAAVSSRGLARRAARLTLDRFRDKAGATPPPAR